MSSSEMLETTPENRRGSARRRRARMVAIPAMLLSLTVGGLGMAEGAHAADAPSCTTLPGATCPAPAPNKGKAKITGNEQHPGKLTQGKMQAITLKLWQNFGWPNWRGIGDRDASWEVNNYVDGHGNHHHEWIETGGRYWDNGDSLRDFMNHGEAGPSSRNYRGTFQEYVAHFFDHAPRENDRTGQDRFVRAINTGDVWFTRDHYKSFVYLGKGPFR
ncbi:MULTISPECIES: hypothetical protein [unclassified Streptomyces]|uniref:hypothetical protein n=1 Tax=unclassified Streptomyces TaxID=2593676 RepID=UPI002366C30F|nr:MULTISPECIES: hypothetical protein [unclassified Streptomyces]MDF3147769.1 hypothetical protein [Streptomyces sp. T21Q-yed]WDF41216.1 hypothetical protein PBV52_32735 [Streptomyces sp. T12]